MSLLSCAEVLRVGYSNHYLLLDKSILTLFKVVFQAGIFFWRLLCFQMSSIFRTIRLSLTPFECAGQAHGKSMISLRLNGF